MTNGIEHFTYINFLSSVSITTSVVLTSTVVSSPILFYYYYGFWSTSIVLSSAVYNYNGISSSIVAVIISFISPALGANASNYDTS